MKSRPYDVWSPERIAGTIKLLWAAFRSLLPEAFEHPETYVIQKTPGVFSIHILAFAILKELRVNRITDPTLDDFKNILQDLGDYVTLRYWERDNPEGAAMAGSMKGFNLIADDMIQQLQDTGKLTE